MASLLQYFMKQSANVRTVVLVVLGMSYIFVGGIIFMVIEKDNEKEDRTLLFAMEEELIAHYNISEKDYQNFTRTILALEPHKSGVQWEFVGALYFCITVVTTIGYGHSVPQTNGGKIASMIYAIFGVPLGLIMFQAMGERINTAAQHGLKAVGHKMGFKIDKVSNACLVPFGLFSCCLIVMIGTLAFANFEQEWTYLESVYYCVMTLTTIGFGDFVALQDERALQTDQLYVAFNFTYIFVGLTVIGAFLNLVVLRIIVGVPNNLEDSTDGDQDKTLSNDGTSFSDAEARSDFNLGHKQDQENSTSKECNSISCLTTTMLCSSCINKKNGNKVSSWVMSSSQENGFKSEKDLKPSPHQIQVCHTASCDSVVDACSYEANQSQAKFEAGSNVPQVMISNAEEESFGMHENREDNIFRQHHVHSSSNFLSPDIMDEHRDYWSLSHDSGYLGTRTQNSSCNLTPSIKNFDDVNEEISTSAEHFHSIEKLNKKTETLERLRSFSMDLGKSNPFREYPVQQNMISKQQDLLSNNDVDRSALKTSHKRFENRVFGFHSNYPTFDVPPTQGYDNEPEYTTTGNNSQRLKYSEQKHEKDQNHNGTEHDDKLQYCDREKLSQTTEQAASLSLPENSQTFTSLPIRQDSDCLLVSRPGYGESNNNLFYNEELDANHKKCFNNHSWQSSNKPKQKESSYPASSCSQHQTSEQSHQPLGSKSQLTNHCFLTEDIKRLTSSSVTHPEQEKRDNCSHCSNSYRSHSVCDECVLSILSRLHENPVTRCSCLVKCNFCGGIINPNIKNTTTPLQETQTNKDLLDTHRSQSGTSLNTKSKINKNLTPEKKSLSLW